MLQFPELLRVITWSTLAVEGLGPFLLFVPWRTGPIRTLAVLLFSYFQITIWLTMSIGRFQPLAIVAMIPYLPAWFWQKGQQLRGRLHAREEPQPDGDAPLPSPLGNPGERPTGGPTGMSTPMSTRMSTGRPTPLRIAAEAACGLALAYVLCSNVLAMPAQSRAMPQAAAVVGRMFGLDQRWHMFANTRVTFQGWHVLVGYLPNGLPINIATGSTEISFDQPELHALDYSNHNWRIYWSSIGEAQSASFRPVLGDYLCRSWNESAPEDVRVSEVEVIRVERIAHANQPVRSRGTRLIRHSCV